MSAQTSAQRNFRQIHGRRAAQMKFGSRDVFFVVHCIDHENAFEKRLAHTDAHKTYVSSATVKVVISGPLLAPDGETMIGSLFVLDVKSRDAVEAYIRDDPFNKAGLWKTVRIHLFNKRVDNRATDGDGSVAEDRQTGTT